MALGAIDARADPLLHNNSIYPLYADESGYAALQKLKDAAREANEAL